MRRIIRIIKTYLRLRKAVWSGRPSDDIVHQHADAVRRDR